MDKVLLLRCGCVGARFGFSFLDRRSRTAYARFPRQFAADMRSERPESPRGYASLPSAGRASREFRNWLARSLTILKVESFYDFRLFLSRRFSIPSETKIDPAATCTRSSILVFLMNFIASLTDVIFVSLHFMRRAIINAFFRRRG